MSGENAPEATVDEDVVDVDDSSEEEPAVDPDDVDEPTEPEAKPAVKPAPPVKPVDDGWTPPTKDEYERIQSGLRKAAAEAKARKAELRRRDEEAEQQRMASATEEERRIAEAKAEASKAVEEKWRTRFLGKAIAHALAEAKARDTKITSRLIDLSEIDIDEDDATLTGLDEQVAELRQKFPELFEQETPVVQVPAQQKRRAAVTGSTQAPPVKMDATRRQLMQAGLIKR